MSTASRLCEIIDSLTGSDSEGMEILTDDIEGGSVLIAACSLHHQFFKVDSDGTTRMGRLLEKMRGNEGLPMEVPVEGWEAAFYMITSPIGIAKLTDFLHSTIGQMSDEDIQKFKKGFLEAQDIGQSSDEKYN